jgi:SSS family solute:Na+ symporter
LLWGVASKELLGPLNLGLIGLMIAALMAALMSTADMMMITTSGLLTHGLYRPLLPGRSEKHYVTVGRTLGGLVVVGAAAISLGSGGLLDILKLWWEFGVIFSAAMWMGILWKRTNRRAVWVQLSVTLVFFFVLSLGLPAVMPGLRDSEYLAKRTQERVVVNQYRSARAEDVTRRTAEIEAWEALPEASRTGPKPEVVRLGEPWTQRTAVQRKAIFWSKGLELVKNTDGSERLRAKGGLNMLSLELVLLDGCGWDLAKNPHALNQTLRVLIRTFVPFILLLVVSMLTRRDEAEEHAAQCVAAKMLTPLGATPDEDERQVALSYRTPDRLDHLKLFGPHSNWQFRKWTRVDAVGFVLNVIVVFLILGALFACVNLGA